MDEASRKIIAQIEEHPTFKTGIGQIARGECPKHAASLTACFFCEVGHMLECHYPLTCKEAKCSHYQQEEGEDETGGILSLYGVRARHVFFADVNHNVSRRLRAMLCCCADDHTVGQGGKHINLIMLRKLAKWPYLTAMHILVPESKKYPLANALVCDRCIEEKRGIKYAVEGRLGSDEPEYYRVPMSELEDPEFFWPDHVPQQNE